MKKILVMSDDIKSGEFTAAWLEKEGNFLVEKRSKNTSIKLLNCKFKFDLLIMDIDVSLNDGWALCREIRKISSIPIIIISPRKEDIYELYGFEIGIDDYIRKPFNPHILIARIKSILSRYCKEKKINYAFNELVINKMGHSVLIHGKPLNLRPKEYDLLLYLIENQGKALSRDQILQDVWNYEYAGYQRTVDSHIKKIRKKLGEKRSFIQTVRNYGYKFSNSPI
ncbi:MAG: response regulator transcription factor [Spirochaetales bacterium]|nr:response regulator transcription factor [Spirochaetales bacterium]